MIKKQRLVFLAASLTVIDVWLKINAVDVW